MKAPLAERMRPEQLDRYKGQEHLTGERGIIRNLLRHKTISSIILWGPPGTGKTTLAYLIAKELKVPFKTLSAISSGVKDIREIIQEAARRTKTLLFIDEIHRFNKSQQDALLAAVERGIITLIGATTENPSFEVNAALLSRCQVYKLHPLSQGDLLGLLKEAMERDVLLKDRPIELLETGALFNLSGGDARRLLNLFELAVESAHGDPLQITDALVMQAAQQKTVLYDKSGEQHYDIISAFIKSIRGSDPNAALYWLARMMEGGEDPKFIARRLLILASEDIGNANPTALVLATNCFQAVTFIGYPECDLILSQTATYLASSPKSNASYTAIRSAQKVVRESGDLPVPLHLRNAPTKLMKKEGYGKNYRYPHNFEGNFAAQEYLPDAIAGTKFYEPGQNPREEELRKRLRAYWKEKYGY